LHAAGSGPCGRQDAAGSAAVVYADPRAHASGLCGIARPAASHHLRACMLPAITWAAACQAAPRSHVLGSPAAGHRSTALGLALDKGNLEMLQLLLRSCVPLAPGAERPAAARACCHPGTLTSTLHDQPAAVCGCCRMISQLQGRVVFCRSQR